MKKTILAVVAIVLTLGIGTAFARTQILPLAVQEPVDFVTQQMWTAINLLQDQVNQFGSQTVQNTQKITNLEQRIATLEALHSTPEIPDVLWYKTFGGSSLDRGYSSQQTSDGGYIITGETSSYGTGDTDFWLIKTDSNGGAQWNKTFGGLGIDSGKSVQQTTDGGYIIAGNTMSYGAGGYDFWLIKTDASGNEQWNRTFGGSNYDNANSVQQTNDGGYIMTGVTNSYGAGGQDVWLIKTDASGNEQWNQTFGGSLMDGAFSVQQTTDNGYVLVGNTNSYGVGGQDVWLIKTDASGNEQWNQTFGGTNSEMGKSVKQTSTGIYIITGETYSYGAGDSDLWLIKADANGNKQWSKTFGGTVFEAGYSVNETNDGGYIVSGVTDSYGAGGHDAWLIKTDEGGNEQWNKTFGGSGNNDLGHSVQQTSDGGYIVAGMTDSYGAGSADFLLVKFK